MAEPGKKQLIGALTKGLIIIETLMECDQIGVTELSKVLNVNKSSAYRLLSTLQERDFVEQDPGTGKYKLGMKLARFRMKILEGIDLRKISLPFLKRLTETTRETSTISIMNEYQGIVVEKQDSPEKISANIVIGLIEPLYCTALGKIHMASLPEEEQERLLASLNLIDYTPKTLTDKAQILEEIKRVKTRGLAIDDEEYSLGMRCLAAPVYNHKSEVIAAMGISGPVSRIRTEKLQDLSAIVKKAALDLSHHLGYHEN